MKKKVLVAFIICFLEAFLSMAQVDDVKQVKLVQSSQTTERALKREGVDSIKQVDSITWYVFRKVGNKDVQDTISVRHLDDTTYTIDLFTFDKRYFRMIASGNNVNRKQNKRVYLKHVDFFEKKPKGDFKKFHEYYRYTPPGQHSAAFLRMLPDDRKYLTLKAVARAVDYIIDTAPNLLLKDIIWVEPKITVVPTPAATDF